jgi:hypothetical protein
MSCIIWARYHRYYPPGVPIPSYFGLHAIMWKGGNWGLGTMQQWKSQRWRKKMVAVLKIGICRLYRIGTAEYMRILQEMWVTLYLHTLQHTGLFLFNV